MTVEIYSRDLVDLVDPAVPVEKLGDGFEFLEGPVWCPDGGYLLFSDIPASKRYRWDAAAGTGSCARANSTSSASTGGCPRPAICS